MGKSFFKLALSILPLLAIALVLNYMVNRSNSNTVESTQVASRGIASVNYTNLNKSQIDGHLKSGFVQTGTEPSSIDLLAHQELNSFYAVRVTDGEVLEISFKNKDLNKAVKWSGDKFFKSHQKALNLDSRPIKKIKITENVIQYFFKNNKKVEVSTSNSNHLIALKVL